MKFLVVGDFHGKFPKFIPKIIKKEKIDLVISTGDYPPFHYRKLWFKHCYGKEVELWEIIGKRKYTKLVLRDLECAEKSLKGLNKLPIPVFTVLGNIDYPSPDDISDFESSNNKSKKNNMPSYDRKDAFVKRLKKYKNIKRFDYKALKFGETIFIGMRGHSNPGYVKSKGFKKHKLKLEKLFKKFRKENKEGKVIFVSHNIAHNTKLDVLSTKALKFASKSAKGDKKQKVKIKQREKHFGSKLARRIINSYQPLLHLGGHIHEAKGKDKVGKTLCINTGAAHEGHAAVIEINEGKIKRVKMV